MITLLLHSLICIGFKYIYRVNFKIAMLAPEYLKDLIKVKSTTRYNLRSDGERLYLKTVV